MCHFQLRQWVEIILLPFSTLAMRTTDQQEVDQPDQSGRVWNTQIVRWMMLDVHPLQIWKYLDIFISSETSPEDS